MNSHFFRLRWAFILQEHLSSLLKRAAFGLSVRWQGTYYLDGLIHLGCIAPGNLQVSPVIAKYDGIAGEFFFEKCLWSFSPSLYWDHSDLTDDSRPIERKAPASILQDPNRQQVRHSKEGDWRELGEAPSYSCVGRVNGNQPGMEKHLRLTGLPSSDRLLIPPIELSQLKTQGNALMQVSLFSAEKSGED